MTPAGAEDAPVDTGALASIADELYGLPPEDFTAARDSRAKALRDDGERSLATEVKKLPKATAAAWVVNLLAREHPDVLAQLVDLGAALRAAQADVDASRMRELNAQRHGVVVAVVRQARAAARGTGRPVSEAVAGQVEETLRAAMADPLAAAAARSGRLVQPMASSGLGPVDVSGAVAVPEALPVGDEAAREPEAAATSPPRPPRARRSLADADEGDDRRRAAAEQARAAEERRRRLREAQDDEKAAADAARQAHETAEAARGQHDDAVARRDETHADVDTLRRRLQEAEEVARAADAAVRETRRHRDTAARAEAGAERALERARHRLRQLDDD